MARKRRAMPVSKVEWWAQSGFRAVSWEVLDFACLEPCRMRGSGGKTAGFSDAVRR